MPDSFSMLCQIPLCMIPLCLIPVYCYARFQIQISTLCLILLCHFLLYHFPLFCYDWFRYDRFRYAHFSFLKLYPIPLCHITLCPSPLWQVPRGLLACIHLGGVWDVWCCSAFPTDIQHVIHIQPLESTATISLRAPFYPKPPSKLHFKEHSSWIMPLTRSSNGMGQKSVLNYLSAGFPPIQTTLKEHNSLVLMMAWPAWYVNNWLFTWAISPLCP